MNHHTCRRGRTALRGAALDSHETKLAPPDHLENPNRFSASAQPTQTGHISIGCYPFLTPRLVRIADKQSDCEVLANHPISTSRVPNNETPQHPKPAPS